MNRYAYDAHKNVIRTDTTSAAATLALILESVYDTRNRLTETHAPHMGLTASATARLLDANSNLVGLTGVALRATGGDLRPHQLPSRDAPFYC
jgi:hypothetical protein